MVTIEEEGRLEKIREVMKRALSLLDEDEVIDCTEYQGYDFEVLCQRIEEVFDKEEEAKR